MKNKNPFTKALNRKIIQDSVLFAILIIIFALIYINNNDIELNWQNVKIFIIFLTSLYIMLLNWYVFSDKKAIKKWYKQNRMYEDIWFYYYRVPVTCRKILIRDKDYLTQENFNEFENKIFLFPLLW